MGAEGKASGWTATRYYRIPEFYGAISYAETGGEEDPWIRTTKRPTRNPKTGEWVGSSTAYGPAQLTVRTANDFVKRYPAYFKQMKNYTDRFARQGELFGKHGMNGGKPGYDPRFDYGGSGTRYRQKVLPGDDTAHYGAAGAGITGTYGEEPRVSCAAAETDSGMARCTGVGRSRVLRARI